MDCTLHYEAGFLIGRTLAGDMVFRVPVAELSGTRLSQLVGGALPLAPWAGRPTHTHGYFCRGEHGAGLDVLASSTGEITLSITPGPADVQGPTRSVTFRPPEECGADPFLWAALMNLADAREQGVRDLAA